ncbi:hypothetical protein [Streptomyces chartreusis]|uniref:hypothetical protein n=1 Tax=Streptomyces chartreusis TaxID=1969 RepID=UPI0036338F58
MGGADHPRYKWVAPTSTTLGILLATINSSIALISLPGIFTGIRLDPFQGAGGANSAASALAVTPPCSSAHPA